jgi:hypothetical protein
MMKRWRLVVSLLAGALVLTAGGASWFLNTGLDPVDTYEVARGAFEMVARHENLDPGDFVPPPPVGVNEPLLLTLRWRSRSRPGCGIEVDVDRVWVLARPRTYCAN